MPLNVVKLITEQASQTERVIDGVLLENAFLSNYSVNKKLI